MNIEIKKLTPALADDYIHFFDVTPHDDNIDDNKCYCVCWCSADHRIETDFSSAQKRRALAVQYVQNGVIQGYLAYDAGQIVGWCNANTKSECTNCTSWLRQMKSIAPADAQTDDKVKSIFCFVIAPGMQRMGIATQLLERVCIDAAFEGFEYVEAYPRKAFTSVAHDFRGPSQMYTKRGFSVCGEISRDLAVVRKRLK